MTLNHESRTAKQIFNLGGTGYHSTSGKLVRRFSMGVVCFEISYLIKFKVSIVKMMDIEFLKKYYHFTRVSNNL